MHLTPGLDQHLYVKRDKYGRGWAHRSSDSHCYRAKWQDAMQETGAKVHAPSTSKCRSRSWMKHRKGCPHEVRQPLLLHKIAGVILQVIGRRVHLAPAYVDQKHQGDYSEDSKGCPHERLLLHQAPCRPLVTKFFCQGQKFLHAGCQWTLYDKDKVLCMQLVSSAVYTCQCCRVKNCNAANSNQLSCARRAAPLRKPPLACCIIHHVQA